MSGLPLSGLAPARRLAPKMAPPRPLTTQEIDALILTGLEAHGQGRIEDARSLYDQALAANPKHADALNLRGVLAFQGGQVQEAIRLIGQAVAILPTHKDAQLNLAEALEAVGQVREALAATRRALSLEPDDAEIHMRLARLNRLGGKPSVALGHANVAVALDPSSPAAHRERASAARLLKKFETASESIDRALALAPGDFESLWEKARLLDDLGLIDKAVAAYRETIQISPESFNARLNLATVLRTSGRVDEALAVIEAAGALRPGDAEIDRQRAMARRDQGDFEGAKAAFRRCLDVDPDNAASLYGLVRLKRLTDSPSERARLLRLASNANPREPDRVLAGFASGELLDQANEPDKAFRQYAQANALHRRQRQARGEMFDASELLAQVESTRTVLAPGFKEVEGWGHPTTLPVFIVGLPRSGTSLVEQICASHSQVTGAGELRLIEGAGWRMAERNAGRDSLSEWDADDARARADEIAAEFERLGPGVEKVIDKTPLNLARLGLIGALLPNARVLWCRRDPRDTVVSLHLTYFARGNAFSTSLSDCAFAVRHLEEIGEIWMRESRLPMMEVRYEDLIRKPGEEARRIIDHLGLPWEDQVLDFQNTERTVATPSSWQVRQPVYSSSVGRWRRYEKHLGPMLRTLDKPG